MKRVWRVRRWRGVVRTKAGGGGDIRDGAATGSGRVRTYFFLRQNGTTTFIRTLTRTRTRRLHTCLMRSCCLPASPTAPPPISTHMPLSRATHFSPSRAYARQSAAASERARAIYANAISTSDSKREVATALFSLSLALSQPLSSPEYSSLSLCLRDSLSLSRVAPPLVSSRLSSLLPPPLSLLLYGFCISATVSRMIW